MDYGGTGSFNNSHYSDHIHFYETNICIAGWNIVVAMYIYMVCGLRTNTCKKIGTGNLDSKTSSDVIGLLKRTSVEFHQTIVMITHNDDIARLADRIIRIEDGKITGGMEL